MSLADIQTEECPGELRGPIFDEHGVIEWHRIKEFQLICLKLLAEQMLLGCPMPKGLPPPKHIEVYVPGEISHQRMSFASRVLLFASQNNPGAAAIADTVRAGTNNGFATTDDRRLAGFERSTSRSGTFAELSASLSALSSRIRRRTNATTSGATHFLLYLNADTFAGEAGERLAAELRAVHEFGSVTVVLAHETDARRGGCEFDRFFETTPQDLIQRGLYKTVAITLCPGAFWPVSVALMARALGAINAGCGAEQRFRTAAAAQPTRPSGADCDLPRSAEVAQLEMPSTVDNLPSNAWLAAAVRPSSSQIDEAESRSRLSMGDERRSSWDFAKQAFASGQLLSGSAKLTEDSMLSSTLTEDQRRKNRRDSLTWGDDAWGKHGPEPKSKPERESSRGSLTKSRTTAQISAGERRAEDAPPKTPAKDNPSSLSYLSRPSLKPPVRPAPSAARLPGPEVRRAGGSVAFLSRLGAHVCPPREPGASATPPTAPPASDETTYHV